MFKRIQQISAEKRGNKPWGMIIAVLFFLMVIIYLYAFLIHRQAVTTLANPFGEVTTEYDVDLKSVVLKKLGADEIETIPNDNGRYTLLNFWATWCPPCLEEMPSLQVMAHNNPDVKLVMVSMDRTKTEEELKNFLKTKLGFSDMSNIYVDSEKSLRDVLNPTNIPVSLLINEKGEVIGQYLGGYDWTDFSVQK